MAIEYAQASQVNAAYTATPATAPTTGWQQYLVNPAGTQNFASEYVEGVANPQDPSMVKQLGTRVGENAAPTLVMDWSKLVAYGFGEGLVRSVPKHPWAQAPLRPTAAVDGGAGVDSFTVAGAVTLPAGTLIQTSGFVNAANNGLFVLVAGSGATALNVVTGTTVAETVSPTDSAMIEIVGFEFAAGDLDINASGDMITAAQSLTVFGLVPGHRVYFRVSAATTSMPTGTYTSGLHYATVAVAPTTNLLTLKDRTFPSSALDGASNTVRLFFGTCYRNVPFGHADYIVEPSWYLELIDSTIGAAGASTYSIAKASVLNSISLNLATESKIEATLSFMSRSIDGYLEAAARYAGASAALRPLGTSLFHTQCESMLAFRIVGVVDNVQLIGQVNTATFAINHNVKMVKAIAGCGSAGAIFGDIDPSLTGMAVFLESADQARAITNSKILRAEMLMKNSQGAIAIDMPTGRLTGGVKTYPENDAVMMNADFVPHGDPANGNLICVVNVIGYLP